MTNYDPEVGDAASAVAEAEAAVAMAEMKVAKVAPVTPITLKNPGAQALEEASQFIRNFLMMPNATTADLMAVWACHTWVFRAGRNSPNIAFLSLVPESGKSMFLEMLKLLSFDAEILGPDTPAVLKAALTEGHTVLYDEVDTYVRTVDSVPMLAGAWNKSFDCDGTQRRANGQRLSSYCPVGFGSLRPLPLATATRTITVMLRPPTRAERKRVMKYSPREHEAWGRETGAALGSWAKSVAMEISAAWPELPADMSGRTEQMWTILFQICDVAGGTWPARIRAAYQATAKGAAPEELTASPLIQLLGNLREIWPRGKDRVASQELCRSLMARDDMPWSDRWQEESATISLATMLRGTGMTPSKLRVQGNPAPFQGYALADLKRVCADLEEAA